MRGGRGGGAVGGGGGGDGKGWFHDSEALGTKHQLRFHDSYFQNKRHFSTFSTKYNCDCQAFFPFAKMNFSSIVIDKNYIS